MFTDTHCHLTDVAFAQTQPEIIAQAQQANVSGCIVPAAQFTDWQNILALKQTFVRRKAIGIHPWFAAEWNETISRSLKNTLAENPELWLGEIGLDFHRATTPEAREQQQHVFRLQIEIAQQSHRPVILHNLKSTQTLVQILRETKFAHGGIAHAFSGSMEEARLLTEQGLLIGLGSLLLNPNAKKVRQLAAQLPLEQIVLETDSPFMLRDTLNTPANTRKVAEIVAELRGISLVELAAQCERNLQRLG
ncbi:TatD family hydrolase [Kingella negevensis]|uniref:Putative deoxyribonuclease YjjV n=1 Tax=Kingella negevensis TaxID=1522312 RepID=A0A238HE92_9NEIS|nr:TatD family hydrolase [Kingella negevensis]MDK4684414.1 TatD family hydrolase [Kingella negevensis]MDK4696421.1 TatD family hydrolase [Kingella negevensis]MDK4707560.1 TatD family hydrolase [Kingella negevensis]MDK4709964.1 TatD family hydrolase [Kingella negevensis]WII93238.1 TatD family hydrolase [Kingella negevensis]